MSSSRLSVIAATLALTAGACATADPPGTGGADARRIDARTADAGLTDAPPTDGRTTDAAIIDAQMVDARPIDAATPVDAPTGCTTTVRQLLANPTFDLSPEGVGWTQVVIDPLYPPITSDDGVPEDTAPAKAWMGGILSGDDAIYQDVAVPLGTTQLVLRGKYDVRTDEFFPGVYDDSQVTMTTTANAVLEIALSVDDDGATTGWTPFSRIFANPRAGQTVRIRIDSHNDDSDVTSFFYDTLALEATVCQ